MPPTVADAELAWKSTAAQARCTETSAEKVERRQGHVHAQRQRGHAGERRREDEKKTTETGPKRAGPTVSGGPRRGQSAVTDSVWPSSLAAAGSISAALTF